jgi:hypothetical protein
MSIPVPRYFHLDLSKLVVRNVSGFCLRAPICVHLFGPICVHLFACTYLRAPICVHLFACTYLDLFALICVHPIVPICTYLRAPISRMEAAAWLVVTSVLVEMNMSRTRCTNTHIHTRMHTWTCLERGARSIHPSRPFTSLWAGKFPFPS